MTVISGGGMAKLAQGRQNWTLPCQTRVWIFKKTWYLQSPTQSHDCTTSAQGLITIRNSLVIGVGQIGETINEFSGAGTPTVNIMASRAPTIAGHTNPDTTDTSPSDPAAPPQNASGRSWGSWSACVSRVCFFFCRKDLHEKDLITILVSSSKGS